MSMVLLNKLDLPSDEAFNAVKKFVLFFIFKINLYSPTFRDQELAPLPLKFDMVASTSMSLSLRASL